MLIRQRISGCDFTGETYKPPIEGYGAVSRGATGRWCVVMWMGPEYYKKYHEGQVKTYEEAYVA